MVAGARHQAQRRNPGRNVEVVRMRFGGEARCGRGNQTIHFRLMFRRLAANRTRQKAPRMAKLRAKGMTWSPCTDPCRRSAP